MVTPTTASAADTASTVRVPSVTAWAPSLPERAKTEPSAAVPTPAPSEARVLREAAALPLPTPDEQFDELVSAVVDRIRGGLRAG
ncbi:hypothetical protein [Streptomyces rubiginosohelvolus]|uniref:hypothetical protein n=1 Tax=Streptomyces rubiginosohelvolus TaxID=67362 RepID=UPI003F4D17E9